MNIDPVILFPIVPNNQKLRMNSISLNGPVKLIRISSEAISAKDIKLNNYVWIQNCRLYGGVKFHQNLKGWNLYFTERERGIDPGHISQLLEQLESYT